MIGHGVLEVETDATHATAQRGVGAECGALSKHVHGEVGPREALDEIELLVLKHASEASIDIRVQNRVRDSVWRLCIAVIVNCAAQSPHLSGALPTA